MKSKNNPQIKAILEQLYKEHKEEVEEWVRETVIPELEEYQNCAGCTHI